MSVLIKRFTYLLTYLLTYLFEVNRALCGGITHGITAEKRLQHLCVLVTLIFDFSTSKM